MSDEIIKQRSHHPIPDTVNQSLITYDANYPDTKFPAIERYAFGSRMPLSYDTRVSLDVHFQPKSTGAEKETDWMPIPPGSTVSPTIRANRLIQLTVDGCKRAQPCGGSKHR